MKKTLLLSVVASTMIMAGGDIAPVEPVVEAPVVASAWDFSGEAVAYYQTASNTAGGIINPLGGTEGLFDQENSAATIGLRLNAVNSDLFWGIGAGFELVGLGTGGLHHDVVSDVLQSADGSLNGGAWTQGYLTYGFGNTSLKVGRQTLPKGLSPFAFSESWTVFQNTFESVLVVNTDLPDTALVYVYVDRANSHTDLSDFNEVNDDGVHLVTVQNKSFDALTLTGSWYYAPDLLVTEDLNILWGDAQYNFGETAYGLVLGLQGGAILGADDIGAEDTTSFGAKIGGNFDMFDISAAFTTVDEGTVGIRNLAAQTAYGETALYTEMLANVDHIARDNDTFVIKAGLNALGGSFGLAYGGTSDNSVLGNDYSEVDFTYAAQVTDTISLLAAYIYQDADLSADTNDVLRFWARYNF